MSSVTGLILAGGRSRRMGRDKALLPLPGAAQQTFLQHLIAVLTPTCSEVLLVARDAAQASLYRDYVSDAVRIITDQTADRGPLMGLYSGLCAAQASHILVTAVDMPCVQPALLSFLLAQPLDDAVILPIVENAPQVMLAIYPRSILPTVEACLRAGQRGPRSLLQQVPVWPLSEEQLRASDPQLRSFININRPEELQAL